jgi:hypothetical protein
MAVGADARRMKNGKLLESIAKKIENLWKMIEHEAPLDNYHIQVGLSSKFKSLIARDSNDAFEGFFSKSKVVIVL